VTDEAAAESRLDRYRRKSTMPLLINGLLFMATLVATLIDPNQVSTWAFWATWFVFLVDFLIEVALSPVKWKFVARHPLTLVSLFFPPLRVWLLVGLAYRAFKMKTSSLQGRVGYAAVYLVAVTIVFGALFEYMAEAGTPASHIDSYADSLWWTFVSITTVGYGDMVPVTAIGRLIAAGIIAVGIATLGVVTATITGTFIKSDSSGPPKELTDAAEKVHTLLSKLDDLGERLARIESHQTTASPGPTAAPSSTDTTESTTSTKSAATPDDELPEH